MIESFKFEEGGRTYSCCIEASRAARGAAWWWVDVSGDTHRYAPFPAEESDTESDIRERVLAYYSHHQTRRSQPTTSHWARRAKPAESAATPADGGGADGADGADGAIEVGAASGGEPAQSAAAGD